MLELEIKTIHGISKLDIIIRFISVIEATPGTAGFRLNRFKSFLVEKFKRGITPTENANLAQGILNYIQSDPGTNERMNAMNYLFELKFLEPKN